MKSIDFDVKTQALVVLDFLVEEEIKEGVNSYVSLLEEGLSAIFPEQNIKQQAEITKIRNKNRRQIEGQFSYFLTSGRWIWLFLPEHRILRQFLRTYSNSEVYRS